MDPPPREPDRPEPPRTRHELAILTALVLGLALNVLVLLRHETLSRADMLLSGTVLLAGLALLGLMEHYRRAGRK